MRLGSSGLYVRIGTSDLQDYFAPYFSSHVNLNTHTGANPHPTQRILVHASIRTLGLRETTLLIRRVSYRTELVPGYSAVRALEPN